MSDDDGATQWKVTWFPPDAAELVFRGSEDAVRRKAEQRAEWNPIIESRKVGPWEMERS